LVALFLAGWKDTFVDPDLTQGGYIATYAIIFTFLAANKANSIFNLLCGLSFERMVPKGNVASLMSVVLSLFHGYVAYVYGDDDSDSSGGGSRDRRLSSDGESQYALYGTNTEFWKVPLGRQRQSFRQYYYCLSCWTGAFKFLSHTSPVLLRVVAVLAHYPGFGRYPLWFPSLGRYPGICFGVVGI
jgi:hypothetical protein